MTDKKNILQKSTNDSTEAEQLQLNGWELVSIEDTHEKDTRRGREGYSIKKYSFIKSEDKDAVEK